MDVYYRIVSLLGGLALFLYGMRIMGDGLKSSSGGVMKAALAQVTNMPLKGFILGLAVTCMIQSSTATIVLTVGLVGAGFLTFRQSIGIVLGANVGTAITAQIIRLMDLDAGAGSLIYFFKSDNLAPTALIIGIILIMFIKKRSAAAVGTIAMGFGILFVGLMNMSAAVSQMSEALSGLLVSFEDNYFLGFLSGVFVTGVIQSSSAVVGILQSIASSVGVRLCGVFAVIVGVNIGDCLTTFLVCRIGAKPEQIRTCLVHIIYNICAAILVFGTLGILRGTGVIGDELWYCNLNSGGVANLHGLFRLVPAIVLLPFANVFAALAEKIVPDKEVNSEDAEIEKNLRELDMHLISNPGISLQESEHLIGHMAEVAVHNYHAAVDQMFRYDPKRDQRMEEREDLLDRMADASNNYIVAISPYIQLERDTRSQSFQYKALTCFERIGDLAININGYLSALRDAGKQFSAKANKELEVVTGAVDDILQLTVEAFSTGSTEVAKRVEPLEEVIDELVDDLKNTHQERMMNNICDVFAGMEFQNILLNLERISDQCSDMAVFLLGRTNDEIYGKEHQYIHNLHRSADGEFRSAYEKNYTKYFNLLRSIDTDDSVNAAQAAEEEK